MFYCEIKKSTAVIDSNKLSTKVRWLFVSQVILNGSIARHSTRNAIYKFAVDTVHKLHGNKK